MSQRCRYPLSCSGSCQGGLDDYKCLRVSVLARSGEEKKNKVKIDNKAEITNGNNTNK